jgi:pimeloyl-ACP methyl ester carboxylesterase
VSINLEDVPYPHPVSHMSLTLYGQDVRMAYMDVKPTATANGQTVVLLHGFNFFGEYWGGTINALTRGGYRVVVPDQIGFGRSSKPVIPYTLNDMAANTRQLLTELHVERAIIVGHSMGGMLASRFAFAYPDFTTHVVMVNQIGLSDGRIGRAPRMIEDAYRGQLARSYQSIRQNIERYFVTWSPAYEKYIRIHYGWTLSGEWPRFAMVRAALQQIISGETVVYDWPHIKSKALVIGGAMDGPNYPEQARRVAESIPGARLEIIDNAGHNPHLEAPQLFHAKLLEFLAAR